MELHQNFISICVDQKKFRKFYFEADKSSTRVFQISQRIANWCIILLIVLVKTAVRVYAQVSLTSVEATLCCRCASKVDDIFIQTNLMRHISVFVPVLVSLFMTFFICLYLYCFYLFSFFYLF